MTANASLKSESPIPWNSGSRENPGNPVFLDGSRLDECGKDAVHSLRQLHTLGEVFTFHRLPISASPKRASGLAAALSPALLKSFEALRIFARSNNVRPVPTCSDALSARPKPHRIYRAEEVQPETE